MRTSWGANVPRMDLSVRHGSNPSPRAAAFGMSECGTESFPWWEARGRQAGRFVCGDIPQKEEKAAEVTGSLRSRPREGEFPQEWTVVPPGMCGEKSRTGDRLRGSGSPRPGSTTPKISKTATGLASCGYAPALEGRNPPARVPRAAYHSPSGPGRPGLRGGFRSWSILGGERPTPPHGPYPHLPAAWFRRLGSA